jgi:hypothetical protein
VLKAEIGTRIWPDRATARAQIFEFIEVFYNHKRLRRHPEFGYLTPLETRERLQSEHTLVDSVRRTCPAQWGNIPAPGQNPTNDPADNPVYQATGRV